MARKKKDLHVESEDLVPVFEYASAILAGRLKVTEALSFRHGIAPPQLGELESLLVGLPPFLSRESVSSVLGVPVTAKTLTNHDYLGTGPRLRFRVAGKVVYPAAFLLEWLEQQDMRPFVARPVLRGLVS